MARIYQENDEIVTVVGSADCPGNAAIFGQADIAVALCPLPRWRCRWVGLDSSRQLGRSRDRNVSPTKVRPLWRGSDTMLARARSEALAPHSQR